jgi:hypothetical protein
VLFLIFLGCTQPDIRNFSNPVMSTEAMEAELIRLYAPNLTAHSSSGGHSDVLP